MMGNYKLQIKQDFARNKYKEIYIFISAFIIPAICMVICYAFSGIYPGGEKTMLATDMDQQFVEFFSWYNRVLNGNGNIMYSFDKGIGGNMFGLWAYYLSSPFSLLMLFFDADKAHIAVWLMAILKVGASGLTFAIFLRYMTKKLDLSTLIFSTAYALMSYSMCYQLIIMWLDGVIFLPLIIIAVEKILRDKKWGMFVIVYPIAIISNYYTAYMITIFIAIWFLFRYFSVKDELYFKRNIKDFFIRISVLIGAGIVGAMLSACVLLPTAADILSGKMSVKLANYTELFTENIVAFPIKIFIGQYDSLTNFYAEKSGTPSIFIGVISMIMVLGFFFNGKVTFREKISAFIIFAVFILSFVFNNIDKIWHMFLSPTWFPCRYAFCFSFFAIYIAYRTFVNIDGLSLAKRILVIFIPFVLMLLIVVTKSDLIKSIDMATATFIVLFAYAVIFIINNIFKKFDLRYAAATILIITLFEMTANGIMIIKGINNQFHYVNSNDFVSKMGSIKDTAEKIEKKYLGFYRVENNARRTINEPLGAGYRGASHYSSTFSSKYNEIQKALGLLQEGINYRYSGSTLVYDSIFGIKYIMSDKETNDAFGLAFENSGVKVYENPYALPIGFVIDNYGEKGNGSYNNSIYILNNNKFTKDLFGEEFFTQSGEVSVYKTGRKIEINKDGAVYMCLPKKYALSKGIKLVLNDKEIPYKYSRIEAKVLYLGEYKDGDVLEVYLNTEDSMKNSTFYTLDLNKFENIINRVKEEGLNVSKFSDTYVEGTVNCKKDGYLFTTIPYEKNGWRAFVDGKEVEIIKAYDVFNSVKLSEGTHTVVFKYCTPYLGLGVGISLGTLLGVISYLYIKRRKEKQLRK